jgi:hypothetical protein
MIVKGELFGGITSRRGDWKESVKGVNRKKVQYIYIHIHTHIYMKIALGNPLKGVQM